MIQVTGLVWSTLILILYPFASTHTRSHPLTPTHSHAHSHSPVLQHLLRSAADTHTPAACANQDLTAITPQGQLFMPGMLKQEYERIGGSCVGFGKPQEDFFRRALQMAEGVHRAKVGGIPACRKLRALHVGGEQTSAYLW